MAQLGGSGPCTTQAQDSSKIPLTSLFRAGRISPKRPLFSLRLYSLRAWETGHHKVFCPAKEDSTLEWFY